ncbi:hypothetical protein [Oscillibacter sp. 1-3]|uniref:hypothetical protein n=1 Tax=Oscillibacter sp. 1-3 TaxID=1235797 RepID=UPI001FA72AFA|nr:hypothetical protein [Oscillibacter sp. 1-3]
MFEKCQNTQATDLFPPFRVDFPCNTQSMAASNCLDRQKNLAPLHILPFIKQGLVIGGEAPVGGVSPDKMAG